MDTIEPKNEERRAPESPLFTENESDARDVLDSLDKSAVDGALKEDVRRVVKRTLKATNGYTPEQKMQAVSQSLFDLSRLFAYTIIHDAKRKPERSWKDTIVECKWAICVLAAIIAGLLILRPEIANITAAAIHGTTAP